jgi:hypothetical protein
MYFIVKNLRRQIEIPPDKFGRMINVRMPTVFPILAVFASATTLVPTSRTPCPQLSFLQNVLATELQRAVEGQVNARATSLTFALL